MLYLEEQRNILEMLFPGEPRYHSLLESYADFFEAEILPGAGRIDQEGLFPRENLAKLTAKGFFGLGFPAEDGGAGLPLPVYTSGLEMLARACANTSLHLSIQGMICDGMRLFSSSEQRQRYLLDYGLVQGKSLISFALTEPCCGSDAKSIQTRAARDGDGYVLSGSKMLISNVGDCDFALVFAKTERGISAFFVSSENPGFRVMKTIPKLGFRGNALAAVRLEDCRVAGVDLLGEEGMGLEYAKHMLNAGRITIAAIGVGIAQAAYEKSLHYSRKRKAFGEEISNFQLVQQKLSDMATDIAAARLLTSHAAFTKHVGGNIAMQAAQAKLFSAEMAQRVCDLAIQIHGGYGYIDAYDVHRHWRDARMLSIGEGTSDMLRLLIAHLALKETGG